MPRPSRAHTASVVLDRFGQTFAQEAEIRPARATPSPLYRLLCLSLPHTPRRMLEVGWAERTRILNRSAYARIGERTSTMLEDGAPLLLDRWRGDLRALREEAERRPDRIRSLLTRSKGIGDAGVDIFFREVQGAWEEIAPSADRRALAAAERLGLGGDARALARLVDRADLPRLVAGLVRVDRGAATDEVLAAGGGGRPRRRAHAACGRRSPSPSPIRSTTARSTALRTSGTAAGNPGTWRPRAGPTVRPSSKASTTRGSTWDDRQTAGVLPRSAATALTAAATARRRPDLDAGTGVTPARWTAAGTVADQVRKSLAL